MNKPSNVVRLDRGTVNWARDQSRIDRARLDNKEIALDLVRAGIAVLFVNGETKKPFTLAHEQLDTEIPADEREEKRRKFFDKEGFDPLVIGATTNKYVVRDVFRKKPDAMPAISCGPSGLIVVDNDIRERDGVLRNGVELFDSFISQHEQLPAGVIVVQTQSGGRHIYFSNPDKMHCITGALKGDYESDVKGVGGYVVAPGTTRIHDNKKYGSRADVAALIRAYKADSLPTIPPFIRDAIGRSAAGEAIRGNDSRVQANIAALKDEWPDYAGVFGPGAPFDVEKLRNGSDTFCNLMDGLRDGDKSFSADRLSLASVLKGASNRMTVRDFATFCCEHPEIFGEYVEKNDGPGTYDDRNLSRDWTRATPSPVSMSQGDGFSAVNDEAEELSDRLDALASAIAKAESDVVLGESNAEIHLASLKDMHAELKGKLSDKAESTTEVGQWYENAINIPVDLDINKLPPRPYLYAKYLMRGHVTLLSAAGGIGKSAWTLDSAIDIACGVDHLGAGEFKPRKVLVYNGEDDQDEMLRRVGAQFTHHNFTPEMRAVVRENLMLISGVESSLRLAEYKDGRVVLKEKAFEKLVEIIDARGIDVVILDPLIGLHSIPENANPEMHVLMSRLKNLAATKLIALLLAHHDKKNIGGKSVDDANQDDARGAGTITTPVRVVLNMRRLSRKDATALRIPPEDVPHIIALSAGAKSNYSARDVTPKLFRAHSVQADNGTDEFAADSTVALAVYTPPKRPDESGGIGEQAALEVLAALDGDEPVGSAPRHANWLGAIIARKMQWDVSDKKVRGTIKGVISDWTARDWIKEAVFEVNGKGASSRKPVGVYKRGGSRPAPRVYEFDAVDDEDGDDA